MSGFLNKPMSLGEFRKKLTTQLIVPMILLGLIVAALNSLRHLANASFTFNQLWQNIIGIFIGDRASLGGLWFVYTLILAKIVGQLFNKKVQGILAIVCLAGAWAYNTFSAHTIENCWLNFLLAFPLFYIGEFIGHYKHLINSVSKPLVLFSLMVIGALGVLVCGSKNDTVWMYRCLYGSNIFLFLLGSVCGTVMIYGFSKLLFNKPSHWFHIISEDSIIILAFHIQLVMMGLHYPIGYGFYIEAAVVVAMFFPAIVFCQKKMLIYWFSEDSINS